MNDKHYHPTALAQAAVLAEMSRALEERYGADVAMEAVLHLSLARLAVERLELRGRA
jgi:hypothetical protein